MANKLATVTGNFLTAGTWVTGNTGTNAVLISTSTSTTALTTGNLDSATFTPANQASQYLAIRIGTRAAGSPTNKMTVILRNNTTATDIWTFVINVSDIDACANTTDDNDGWYVFKAAASLTPNGTDTYLVRCKLDSTSTAVALCTNGTANNWQRQMFQTATGAPAPADDMLIAGVWDTTNPAVKTNVTVTMDETADTDYGSNTTNYRTAALNICKGGTLTFSPSINSNLRLSGFAEVYSGGTLNQGTSGSPIQRTKTAKLRFDPVADVDRGLEIRLGGARNLYGQSPLSGVSNTYCLLTADAAAAATSVSVDRNLSAANGDTVGFSPTGTTRTQYETVTLNADATSTTLSLSAGLANAHNGDNGQVGEAFSLTRNARVESVTSTLMTFEYWMAGSTCAADWASWQYVGQGGTIAGVRVANTNGSITNCVVKDSDGIGMLVTGTTPTLTGITVYNTNPGAGIGAFQVNATTTGCVMNNIVVAGIASANGAGLALLSPGSFTQCDNLFASGAGGGTASIFLGPGVGGTTLSSGNGLTANNWTAHSSSAQNITIEGVTDFNLVGSDTWANGGSAGSLLLSAIARCNFTSLRMQTGNPNLQFNGGVVSDVNFNNCYIAGSSSVAGVGVANNAMVRNVQFNNCKFGSTGGGFYAANFLSKDFLTQNSANNQNFYDILFNSCSFDQSLTTFHSGGFNINGCIVRFQNGNGTAGNHSVDLAGVGRVARETTTVDVSPSIKMTPSSASLKLDTAACQSGEGFFVPVDSGQTPTISIKVQKDASYNGNAPRLILKANPSLGFTSDTVIATFSGSSGSWQTVSGTTAAATDKGVLEFVVDCDGTAGNIFVDTLTVSGTGADALSGLSYWYGGLAC